MKTPPLPSALRRTVTALLAICLAAMAISKSASQTPSDGASAPAAAPTLTPEQRREFAQLQEKLTGDAEYQAAVKRAIEAQRAADNLFFAKMTKAAGPELQAYIKFLQQSRAAATPSP
jgi:hypothetical protein